jgi:hypothetical protein
MNCINHPVDDNVYPIGIGGANVVSKLLVATGR